MSSNSNGKKKRVFDANKTWLRKVLEKFIKEKGIKKIKFLSLKNCIVICPSASKKKTFLKVALEGLGSKEKPFYFSISYFRIREPILTKGISKEEMEEELSAL